MGWFGGRGVWWSLGGGGGTDSQDSNPAQQHPLATDETNALHLVMEELFTRGWTEMEISMCMHAGMNPLLVDIQEIRLAQAKQVKE